MAGSRSGLKLRRLAIALAWFGAGAIGSLQGQEPPSAEGVTADAEPMTPREAALEARVRQLEVMVERLSNQIPPAATTTSGPGAAAPDVGVPATTEKPSAPGGAGAPGAVLPPNPAPSSRFDSPATLESKTSNVIFGPGFELRTDDDEYILQFHDLTQFDYRGYQQSNHATERDSFLIPRQWWIFSGRMTKPIGYYLSFANGFDSLAILDVFLDYDFDPRFRVRAGRTKSPFMYEFFINPTQGMILPEYSVFFNNFGENRDLGVMAFGRLFKETVDYGVGIFNGSRNGFVAKTDSKFISGLVNWKPFNNAKGSALENFSIGGSVFGGANDNAPFPQIMRTIVPTSGNSVAGVPFLAFNDDVREVGPMTFWDLHTAYYYRGLAINAEWASGFQGYARNDGLAYRTRLPVQSFYVLAGYLLTGETRSSSGIVKPLHPFRLGDGKLGLGAWELTGRYQQMNIGKKVFTNGLADPNLWTNSLFITELGFNWHINQYLKFMFEWEHSEFGQPVFFNTGARSKTSNLFLARIQLFF